MLADWLHAALRFAHDALLLGLCGAPLFRITGLRHLVLENPRNHVAVVAIAAIAAPVISVVLMLVSVAAMMGQPVVDLDWATLVSLV